MTAAGVSKKRSGSSGEQRLAEFVEAVRAGRMPSAATLEWLAASFSRVLDGSLRTQNLDASLGLRRTRGRPQKPERDSIGNLRRKPLRRTSTRGHVATYEQIWTFIGERFLSYDGRGALRRAIDDAVAHFGCDERTVTRAWKHVAPLYRAAKARGSRNAIAPGLDRLRRVDQITATAASNLALIRQYVTDAELDGELSERYVEDVLRIARQRAKKVKAAIK